MKISHQDHGQLCVLSVKGELTAENSQKLHQLVEERIEKQVRDFVLDMSELEFIDSRGLEALIRLQETCGDLLGQVRLAGVQNNIAQVLRITRLAPRFEQHADVESAIASLRI